MQLPALAGMAQAGVGVAAGGGGMALAAPALVTAAVSGVLSVGFVYTCIQAYEASERCYQNHAWYNPICGTLGAAAVSTCAAGAATGIASGGILLKVLDKNTVSKYMDVMMKLFKIKIAP